MASEIPVKFGISAVWDDARKTFSDVNRGLDKLGDSVKGYGREQREQAKYARLFANELRSIVPGASAASNALIGLGSSLLGGVGILAAFDAIKVGVQYFRDLKVEAEAAAKAATESARATADAFARLEESRQRGIIGGLPNETPGQKFDRSKAQVELDFWKDRTDLLRDIRKAEDDLREAEKKAQEQSNPRLRWDARSRLDALNAILNQSYGMEKAAIDRLVVERIAAEKKVADERLRLIAENAKKAKLFEFSGGGPVPFSGQTTIGNQFSQYASGKDFAPAASDLSFLTPPMDFNSAESKKAWEDMRAEIERTRATAEGAGEAIGAALAQSFQSGSDGAIGFGKVVLDQVLMAVQARAVEAAATSASSIPFPANVALAAASFAFVRGMIAQIPARAEGGPVYAGQPYLVGERGPELFTPGASGGITPNHKLGGQSITVIATDAKSLARQLEDVDSRLSRAVRSSMRRPRV